VCVCVCVCEIERVEVEEVRETGSLNMVSMQLLTASVHQTTLLSQRNTRCSAQLVQRRVASVNRL
jgi:hypothetical protein